MPSVLGRRDTIVTEDAAARRARRLQGFNPPLRRCISEFASSPELEDLADSFPALLFALASDFATPEKRSRAVALVIGGASLREASDAIGLAYWLRRLPAIAFQAPLPTLPADPDFSLRVTSLIPEHPGLMATWLERVSQAHAMCGPGYALWIARQSDLVSPPEEQFHFMAAWAWHSQRPGLLGNRLLRRGWSPEMSFKRARDEVGAWRQRLRLIECLGPGIESPWLTDGAASGFNFVALRTVDDFIAESVALENCLDQYADQLHTGRTALFSIRKGARRVACVEIGLHDEEVTMPTIVQLRGLRNRRAPPEIWQATFAWLGGQRLAPLSPSRHAPTAVQCSQARQQLWHPYLEFIARSRFEKEFRRLVLRDVRPARRGRRATPRTAQPQDLRRPIEPTPAQPVVARMRALGDA